MQGIGWLDADPAHRAKLMHSLEFSEDVRHRMAFQEMLAGFLRSLTTEKRKAVHDAESASAETAGHKPKYIGSEMSDQFQCACGWESNGYWDGNDFAWEEWRWHMLKEGIQVDYPGYPEYEPLTRLCELKKAAAGEPKLQAE